jgi:hypothetical protein
MTTNQESRHQDLRDRTSTARSTSSDWHAYWDSQSVAAGTFNERILAWINTTLGTSYTNLAGAMHAYALNSGFSNWHSIGELTLTQSDARGAVSGETNALSLDFTDDYFQPTTGYYGSAYVLDSGTPANDYDSYPDGLLDVGGNSMEKMVLGPSGTLQYAPHNLLLDSNDFSVGTSWVIDGGTESSGTFTEDSNPSTEHKVVANSGNRPSWPSGQLFRSAVEISASSTRRYVCFGIGKSYATFDLVTGTRTETGNGVGVSDHVDSDIEDLGDGYYRIWLVAERTGAGTGVIVAILSGADSSTPGNNSPQYDGDGSTIIFRNMHVNHYPADTTYVPTTDSAKYGLAYDWYTSGTQRGILVEPAAENLFAYSQDFDDTATSGAWTNSNTDTLAQDADGPDGVTNSATTLVDSGATGTGQVFVNELSVPVSESTTYTFSVYAAEDQLDWLVLNTNGFTTPANGNTDFSLASNASTDTEAADHTAGSEFVKTIGGVDWYRCWITFTTGVGVVSGNLRIAVNDDSLTNNSLYQVDLDGTSSILIYGAQFEEGSVPTSLIQTFGDTATRDADDITLATSATPYADGSAGTIYVEAYTDEPALERTMVEFGDTGTGASARTLLQHRTTDALLAYINTGSGNSVTVGDVMDTSAVNRAAMAFDTNDLAVLANGVSPTTDATVTLATGATTLFIGQNLNNGAQYKGHIRRVIYLPRRVSNADLEDWTTTGDLP